MRGKEIGSIDLGVYLAQSLLVSVELVVSVVTVVQCFCDLTLSYLYCSLEKLVHNDLWWWYMRHVVMVAEDMRFGV
jgi:hypothetical protein